MAEPGLSQVTQPPGHSLVDGCVGQCSAQVNVTDLLRLLSIIHAIQRLWLIVMSPPVPILSPRRPPPFFSSNKSLMGAYGKPVHEDTLGMLSTWLLRCPVNFWRERGRQEKRGGKRTKEGRRESRDQGISSMFVAKILHTRLAPLLRIVENYLWGNYTHKQVMEGSCIICTFNPCRLNHPCSEQRCDYDRR